MNRATLNSEAPVPDAVDRAVANAPVGMVGTDVIDRALANRPGGLDAIGRYLINAPESAPAPPTATTTPEAFSWTGASVGAAIALGAIVVLLVAGLVDRQLPAPRATLALGPRASEHVVLLNPRAARTPSGVLRFWRTGTEHDGGARIRAMADRSEPQAVRLTEKLSTFNEQWAPRTVATFNGHDVMVVKVKGEFVWHHHDETDDFFLVLAGRLTIRLRDRDVHLGPGELFVVPAGVEHQPFAEDEAEVLLIERAGTPNTGDQATVAPRIEI